jgi:hypothetical protein
VNERLRSKLGNERCKGFFGRSFGKYKGEAVERSSSPRVVRTRELLLDRSNGMADIDTKVESICEEVIRRNPGEPEFHQAVREVAGSLGPVLEKHPEFVKKDLREALRTRPPDHVPGGLAGR